ncbi:pimeloyl-ACP methyl ester carboxylesterase [Actinomycetospora succinea]|uniref:Pimeloyl-ACP methyl ester carboxylesterase n=1 Tax=Actinomycetospora succinea TaxID=663603 RepID=A0A4R6UJ71_9PSEU|nr:alpha/beta hydrolase [Actinomycetospora succinea]TDQ46980.1 pimeloyl-ACP methyl ester carboxylesterase [Actinomycetospora succinea]
MTVVLVHGNPESAALWDPLVAELARAGVDDVVRLSPPGFGVPLPAGFPATVTAYRDWLIGELERFERPVDLLGHDWGGGHLATALMARPELVRSWASDALGLFEPDYTWHDLAQIWQTPGDGEAHLEELFGGTPAQRAEQMESFGVGHAEALQLAGAQNEDMKQAILALYRSAAQPAMATLGKELPTLAARPGLALLATADPFGGTEELRRRAADRAGAEVAVLDELGHWWMSEDPARAARVLTAFWRARAWSA